MASCLNIEDRITPVPILSEEFKAEFVKKSATFGFDGFGEFVFMRTYSRKKSDGTNETFPECIIRVAEGIFNIRRHYLLKIKEGLPANYAEDAENFCHYVLTMRFMPPGRALWSCGTDTMYRVGSTSLNNCAFISTKDNLAESVSMSMDYLMLGVGVGFDTLYSGKIHAQDKNNGFVYVIPDSREGWIDSIVLLIEAYTLTPESTPCVLLSESTGEFFTNTNDNRGKTPVFDYTRIRAKGEPIKGFGGIASGADPLIQLHERLNIFFEKFLTANLPDDACGPSDYNRTRLIADICNAIGCCVVSGNVRRCLPHGALVHTEGGLVPIQEIEPGTYVLSDDNQYHKVVRTFEQGRQNIVRVSTDDGYFECTPNHRIAVSTEDGFEWVEAGLLRDGDYVFTPRECLPGKRKTLMPCPTWESKRISFKYPEYLTPELSWVIGCFTMNGEVKPNYQLDGSGSSAHVTFGSFKQAQKMLGVLRSSFKRLIPDKEKPVDVTVHIRRDTEKNYKVVTNDRDLVWYIHTYMRHYNIPSIIYTASEACRRSYIAGVWEIRSIDCTLEFDYESSRSYVRDLQMLMYSCGMESKMSFDVAQSVLSAYDDNYTIIPTLTVTSKHTISSLNRNSDFVCKIDDYVDYYGRSERAVAVKSIAYLTEPIETYDIEVESSHNFFCDGYLVHNSAMLCVGDPQSETFLNLKNYELNPDRSQIGWMSNNTCRFISHEDFAQIPKIAERIKTNGEPGFANFANIQKYGRIGDHNRPAWSRETEPDKATGMNPCSEIPLEDGELCNLAEVIPSRCRGADGKFSMEIFLQALYYATLCASTISLFMTHRERTNKVLRKNRRIGVSLTGIAELYTEIGFTELIKVLRSGYTFVRECNHIFATQAGVPDSIRVTTVKPSGTLSLLAGVSPGIHFPTFRYARRNVRVADNSPIAKHLIKYKVPYEKDLYSDNTLVFGFGIDQGKTREATEVPISEQFMLLVTLQREWSDNMVSVTIYFDPKKESELLEYNIALHAPVVKSFSILPHVDEGVYPQSPYMRISRYEFRMLRKFNKLDWSLFVGGSDGECEKYCNNDVCEVIPPAARLDLIDYIHVVDDSSDDELATQHKHIVDPPYSSLLSSIINRFF